MDDGDRALPVVVEVVRQVRVVLVVGQDDQLSVWETKRVLADLGRDQLVHELLSGDPPDDHVHPVRVRLDGLQGLRGHRIGAIRRQHNHDHVLLTQEGRHVRLGDVLEVHDVDDLPFRR